ncbi:unnamed protein product [Rodentolepis nana]|uniref:Uncharacterized protein n=1 Tax=Rodentolepis nana TaxID=102285 RepID=A0A0R3TK73_RODNA|nr:unnamed protein product [Rodentolepis nana]
MSVANELSVTMPMQLAVVDTAIVAARGGSRACLEADAATGSIVEIGDNQDTSKSSIHQAHYRYPIEHSSDAGIESGSTSRPMNTPHAVSIPSIRSYFRSSI